MPPNIVTDCIRDAACVLPTFDHPHEGRILVTDGSGAIGYRVASRLLQAGYATVRVGVEKSTTKTVGPFVEQGAEVKEFSWDKDATYARALDDVTSVFVTQDSKNGAEDRFRDFLAVCKRARVKHVVKLSYYHAMAHKSTDVMATFAHSRATNDPFARVPLVQMHGKCDMKLVKSGLNYTIVFASHLMSNPLCHQSDSIRIEHKFYGASAGKGVNYVSPNDVAEVAVRALLAPRGHSRVGYTLTGPTAITDKEVASCLEKEMNTSVTFVDNTHSLPKNMGPDFVALEKAKASGVEESATFSSKNFETICRHSLETYEEYLLNKESMSPSELVAFAPCIREPSREAAMGLWSS